MMPRRRALLALLVLVLLAGCSGPGFAAQGTPTPTEEALAPPTAAPLETPTETIVWFPPTDTPTPRPTATVQPTQDMRPGLGAQILTDPFLNTAFWPTYRIPAGSVGYGNGELTLAVHQPRELLSTLRKDTVLEDFYLEVSVEPSLCRGADNFGLLFRSLSEWNTYRFAISCEGQIRIERVRNGSVYPLKDWAPGEMLLPANTRTMRLGLLAAGEEFRFFIDDIYQFSVRDPIFTSGQVGLFARSTGETALTVSFQDMAVWAVDAESVRPTATPEPSPTATRTRAPTPTAEGASGIGG